MSVAADTPTEWAVTAFGDNTAITASKAAEPGKSHYITSIQGSFTASQTAGKDLTLEEGATVLFRIYTHSSVVIPFPTPFKLSEGQSADAVLAASGTAGQIGRVTLTGFTR